MAITLNFKILQNTPPHHILSSEERNDRLRVINQFAMALLELQNVEDVAWTITERAIEHLWFVDCVVYLSNQEDGSLTQVAAYGSKRDVNRKIINPITLNIGEGIVGGVAANGKAEIIHDTTKDPRYITDHQTCLSELSVPIKHGEYVMGVIDSEHPRSHFYTQNDLEILQTIASMTASKLLKLYYQEELFKHKESLEQTIIQRTHELKRSLEDLEKKKEELLRKNNELTDSLIYAQRIQKAVLPDEEQFRVIFPHSFVFFKPKDIVAGDFYWKHEDEFIKVLAVGDCTGHGVPGALLSVLGTYSLSKASVVQERRDPAYFIEKTREAFAELFYQSNTGRIHDGLELSVVVYHKSTATLQFCGANQSIMLIGADRVRYFKGEKNAIEFTTLDHHYTNIEIPYRTGDVVCLYTDGIKDQFGGEQGKKLKQSNFSNIMQLVCDAPADERQQRLEQVLHHWMHRHEQVDDICIVGFQL